MCTVNLITYRLVLR